MTVQGPPAAWWAPEAPQRIIAGLRRGGISEQRAAWAADRALAEAPFTEPPDADGWAFVCRRAREIAVRGLGS